MESVISVVLEALVAGAKVTASDIASTEIKQIYDALKSRIIDKWVGQPEGEQVLSGYQESRELWEDLLAQKLKAADIQSDQEAYHQAQLIVQKADVLANTVSSNNESNKISDFSRNNSPGDVAMDKAKISNINSSAANDSFVNTGSIKNDTSIRETRLSILLVLVVFALVCVLGFAFYLFKTERLELPGLNSNKTNEKVVEDIKDITQVDKVAADKAAADKAAADKAAADKAAAERAAADKAAAERAAAGRNSCIVTITSPLVSLHIEPDPFSQEIINVEPGDYFVLTSTFRETPISRRRWLKIEAEGRQGWVRDDTFTIDSKSSACE